MAKVRLLPEVLANQIAAGEIVERPASVAKELLENSLDAAARRVVIDCRDGGKSLISVSDDGIGMSREDAQMALQHHATSKISQVEDLSKITTLGFRGEALPSIASVSRVRLRTASRDDLENGHPVGTEIEISGGTIQRVSDLSWTAGTEILVEDLFFNVPARRKFLKTAPTELSHISRHVINYALAYPEVEFQFSHQERKIVDAPAVDSLRERVFQLLGDSFLENLARVEYERAEVRITGFASLPHEQRNNANSLFLYVNRRMVRDRILTHAVRQVYQNLIPSSAYPVVLLLLEIDPQQIDVNVHPSKTEIRFRDSGLVHRAVFHALEEALLLHKTALGSLARDVSLSRQPFEASQHSSACGSLENYLRRTAGESGGFHFQASRNGLAESPSLHSSHSRFEPVQAYSAQGASDFEPLSDLHGEAIPQEGSWSQVPVILGQLVESFIVAGDRQGVLLVDQHVAHERVLYDQSLRSMEAESGLHIQRLLLPLILDLTPQQKAVAESLLEHLNANGFEVEWFGQRTLAVKGIPSLAGNCDALELLQKMLCELEDLVEGNEGGPAPDAKLRRLRQKIAISLACRAAIKINTPLSRDKMQWLLDELFACENPYTCPHGRPIVLRLSLEEILRAFKRI